MTRPGGSELPIVPPLLPQQSAQIPSVVVRVSRPQCGQGDSGASRSRATALLENSPEGRRRPRTQSG